MIYFYIFGALSIVLGTASGYCNIKRKHTLRLIVKMLGSLCFVGLGLYGLSCTTDAAYSVTVFAALIFGMLGDIFMAMKNLVLENNRFMFEAMGYTAFAVGHICFICSFIAKTAFNWYLLPVVIVFPLIILAAYLAGLIRKTKLLPAFLVYATMLGLMLVSTLNLFINEGGTKSIIALVAAILFSISDGSLLTRSYAARLNPIAKNVLIYTVLVTYYIAQVLFALTMIL